MHQRLYLVIIHLTAVLSLIAAQTTESLITTAAQIAQSLRSTFPSPSLTLVPQPYYWWESGLANTALLTYAFITGDKQYEDLAKNTLYNQATAANDFMTPEATGNDDQAWWALAALTAAENNVPVQPGAPSFLSMAQNVFNEQKSRWYADTCSGGLKWKIRAGDPGYEYKSSITNGLFFQLAARLGKLTGDVDALNWAEKTYDWVLSVGLIDGDYNVFDGTDDTKGCIDVNHDQWSYNAGVFLYGAAVMAAETGDQKWVDRTSGLLDAAQRNFVRDGALVETKCKGDGSCNTDQVFFKGIMAGCLGATAVLTPAVGEAVAGMMVELAARIQSTLVPNQGVADYYVGLQVVNAAIMARGDASTATMAGMISSRSSNDSISNLGRRSIAGRVWWKR